MHMFSSAHVVAYGVERSTRFGICSGGGGDNIFSILADGKVLEIRGCILSKVHIFNNSLAKGTISTCNSLAPITVNI